MIFLFQVKEAVPINPDGSVGDEDDTGNEEVGVCVLEDGMGVRAKCVCVFACVCVWGGGVIQANMHVCMSVGAN